MTSTEITQSSNLQASNPIVYCTNWCLQEYAAIQHHQVLLGLLTSTNSLHFLEYTDIAIVRLFCAR
jgi:hypothetical protein